jgi:signal transduction histidine kinase
VTLVNPVDLGARMIQEGITNPTIVLPPFQDLGTNARPPGPQPPRRPQPDEGPPREEGARQQPDQGPPREPRELNAAPPPADGTNAPPPRGDRGEGGRSRRPWWMRGMDDQEFQKMLERRAVHGLVLAISTKSLETAQFRDLWLRALIVALASLAGVGSALAWRNLARSADLQIRLVRASELNTHLREMNLAAAGLAHETKNPLNIIRGLAQMLSKRPDADGDVRARSLDIVNQADRVAAQLNEFINYSRPREVRRSVLAMGSVIAEVVRALSYDLEEKAIQLQVKGDSLKIEADDQLLRQALFNLLLNAIQAVQRNGEIQIVVEKAGATEARLEIRDNGPGVPPESRQEIFKPYFTMQEKGTGLGLAVVQQIVLAHGWEIVCDANQPRGAVFRLSHLKVVPA